MSIFAKRYHLVVFLSFVAAVMLFVKLFYRPDYSQLKPPVMVEISPTSVPTMIPTPTEAIAAATASDSASWEAVADQKMPLWRLLPYKGDGFTVEAYSNFDTIVVTLNNSTKTKVTPLLKTWIKGNGGDPVILKIDWR